MEMKVTLNAKAITDEMMALTALRSATMNNDNTEKGAAAPLLTRDHLPGLRVVMRMVFAELILGLGNLVEECDIDEEDALHALPYSDEAPMKLSLTLRDAGNMSTGQTLAVKRQLEHLVAAGTLGWVATDSDSEFARTMQHQREGALAALRDTLAAHSPAPAISPWP